MNASPALSPFELAAAELRKLAITLTSSPGEYRVNFRDGSEATARTTETLNEALEAGRSMAAEVATAAPPPRGKRRRPQRRLTPKAYNKRLRMAHLRRMRAHAG